MKSFQVTITAGKDVKDVEANAAGSEQDKDAKNKKVIFDLEKKTIIILAFSLRLIREKGFQYDKLNKVIKLKLNHFSFERNL
jgi:hypothetical protein